jgi:hypothetical protein
MDQDEVQRYLDTSIAHSVTIDVREIAEAPGHLRTITIHAGIQVTIEFQKCSEYIEGDWEGGGLKYVGQYDALEEAVRDLEGYLATPIGKWRNYTRERYEPLMVTEADSTENLAYFENQVRQRSIPLPEHGGFVLAGIHWRHIQRYGEYRPDKLLEEQDLMLREQGIEPGDDDS